VKPSPAHKYCNTCRQYKHRQEFVARGTRGPVLDSVCHYCRPKLKDKAPLSLLLKRANRGLLHEVTFDRAIERRRGIKIEKVTATQNENVKVQKRQTWRILERSIDITRSVLNNYDFDTPEKQAWRDEMRALVNEANQECALRRRLEPCPYQGRPPWYAPLPNAVTRVRALINNYPEGAEKSPIQML
jgi:hypothetical protein